MKKAVFLFSSIFLIALGTLMLSSWTSVSNNHSCDPTLEHNHSHGWYDCKRCDGTGRDPVLACRNCSGKGYRTLSKACDYGCKNGKVKDRYGDEVNCPRCNGTNKVSYDQTCPNCSGWGKAKCSTCGGSGKVQRDD